MSHFDLLTRPWIPVVGPDGDSELLGFSEVILRGHELVRISDPSPAIQFGLYRWLTVLVQAAFQVNEFEDLEDRWAEGRFSESEWARYIDRVGARRFNLFDSEKPFMQTPSHGGRKDDRKSVAELFYHFPKGEQCASFHLYRRGESRHRPGCGCTGFEFDSAFHDGRRTGILTLNQRYAPVVLTPVGQESLRNTPVELPSLSS